MPRARTIDELQELREQASRADGASPEGQTRITVGMGTCGIAAGAREVMHAILDELERRDVRASITTSPCIGLCAHEPLVEIQNGGTRVTYGNVQPARVPRLVEEHLVNNRVVAEWVIDPTA